MNSHEKKREESFEVLYLISVAVNGALDVEIKSISVAVSLSKSPMYV